MQHLKNNEEKYEKIEEALTEALPKGKVSSWLTLILTDDNSFAVMGNCSEFDKKAMIVEFTMMDMMGDLELREVNDNEKEQNNE